MINDFRFKNNKKTFGFKPQAYGFCSLFFALCSLFSFSQVTSSIDSTSIKIGEQITFKVEVESDTTNIVVFPEGQTFMPLEMIESYKVDTIKNNSKLKLVKKYGLTQFDSGSYTIPRQKIVIGTKTFFTDSLKVEVNNIEVDTTKQGLYDIKPLIEVDKSSSNWWKTLVLILLILVLIGFLLYWFIWRKKPLTEEEEIALLAPYDRAKLALQKLDESNFLENAKLKDYYSELTFIIRRYLDEKVYDRALESTTEELVNRLTLLKDGNQIELSKDDIRNIETILKRADLVKFAKSKPNIELAKLDRNTIDLEIDNVKEALPEPTEEEKLLNQQYKQEQERKQWRRKIMFTSLIVVFLIIATIIGFGVKYGFGYVKDTVFGHDSKELLEGNWVTSEYGFPPITISTPKVLKWFELPLPDNIKQQVKSTTFVHGSLLGSFSIMVNTTTFLQGQQQLQQNQQAGDQSQQPQIDLNQASEGAIKQMEAQGAKDIVVKQEKFITPNAAEGLKTFGYLKVPLLNTDNYVDGKYVLLQFTTQNVLQQVVITWHVNDNYAEQMVERILNSVELNPDKE